jgi:hypothetical protein
VREKFGQAMALLGLPEARMGRREKVVKCEALMEEAADALRKFKQKRPD